jgi:ABC-type sugar transport system permease subunit
VNLLFLLLLSSSHVVSAFLFLLPSFVLLFIFPLFFAFCVSLSSLDDSSISSKENVSENLFKKVKKSLPYCGDVSSSYSISPFLLSYNGHHDDGHYADSIYERKFIDEVSVLVTLACFFLIFLSLSHLSTLPLFHFSHFRYHPFFLFFICLSLVSLFSLIRSLIV